MKGISELKPGPGLIQELFWNLDPDLIDFHLNKANLWQMIERISRDPDGTFSS